MVRTKPIAIRSYKRPLIEHNFFLKFHQAQREDLLDNFLAYDEIDTEDDNDEYYEYDLYEQSDDEDIDDFDNDSDYSDDTIYE